MAEPAPANVDDVAVQRCIDGSYPTPRLNTAERAEAVRRMAADGASITQTAQRLGITPRHVSWLRAQAPQPPAPARRTTTPGRVPAPKLSGEQ